MNYALKCGGRMYVELYFMENGSDDGAYYWFVN